MYGWEQEKQQGIQYLPTKLPNESELILCLNNLIILLQILFHLIKLFEMKFNWYLFNTILTSINAI